VAKNTNKRIAVKWVRDLAKSAYEKADSCWICKTTADLELHHLHSITLLLERWAAERGYDISTDAGICAHREEFIAEHHRELYEQVYTLCNQHHQKLHKVFGKTPLWNSWEKQERWLQRERDLVDGVKPKASVGGMFKKFC
jgi:5-methylcytosine-specific restriction endonuclease McrA